jgi:class 3 adenylate cyclase
MERRLAAILAADVAGYSRLMGADEAGTLKALKAHRRELIDPSVAHHHGHIVKLMGDGMLIEFNSVVDAVALAVAIQLEMNQRNRLTPADRAVTFRIGINIGDVIVEEGDIYGEGVNVAARLEALADPGGICISRNVRDEIRNKLDLTLRDMGEIEVKNILRPVRAFQVVLDAKTAVIASVGQPPPTPPRTVSQQRRLVTAAALLSAFAFGNVTWSFATSDEEPIARHAPLAALPVTASTGDSLLTEDMIAALSRCRRGEYVSSLDRPGAN